MSTTATISWLNEDFTGKSALNYVTGEVHKAETKGNMSRFVIVPAEGAFYDTDNLKVVYHTGIEDNQTVLIRDTDYRLVGIDHGRTRVSSAKGGVYHFILITTVFYYDANSYITIDYQAFGGYLSSAAYSAMLDEINRLNEKINISGVLTAATLPATETIQTIVSQLQSLAARMQYAPSVRYLAGTSYGTTTVWNTFAISSESYDKTINRAKPGSLHGIGVFTFISDYLEMKVAIQYDLSDPKPVINSVDILQQKLYQFDIQRGTANSFFENGLMLLPKFRVAADIRNFETKLYLQFALVDNQDKKVNFVVTDSTDLTMDDVTNVYVLTPDTTFQEGKTYYIKEGTDNYYRYSKVDVTVGDPVPADTYYNLTSIAQVNNPNFASKFVLCPQSATMPAPTPSSSHLISDDVLAVKQGFKLWEGNMNLALVQDLSYTGIEITKEYNVPDKLAQFKTEKGMPLIHCGPDATSLNLRTIKTITIDVYDRLEARLLTVSAPAKVVDPYRSPATSNVEIVATECYYIPDLGIVDVCLRNVNNVTSLNIYAKSGKSSYVNQRFDLRTIYIN